MSKRDIPAKFAEQVPLNISTQVPVDWLNLDPRNPRLVDANIGTSDEAIIAHLFRAEDLSELLQSVAANGYMDIEPLVVFEEENGFTVLEGNRRLAAILLLSNPGLSDKVFQAAKTKIHVPEITQQCRDTFERISVYRVGNREDADAFTGFKHINGAVRWSAYAKAQFAVRWQRASKLSLSEIANQIGDRNTTIKRMVHSIHVLEQAEEKALFDIEDCWNPDFSIFNLYVALPRQSYRNFLGLDPNWASYEPKPNPVPEENEKLLTELLTWIYGSSKDEIAPVIKFSNPDITRLGEVLDCSEALATLRAGKSLDQAHERTLSAEQKLRESLLLTRAKIHEAFHNVRGFDIQDISLIAIADEISEAAQAIHHQMKTKREKFCKDTYG